MNLSYVIHYTHHIFVSSIKLGVAPFLYYMSTKNASAEGEVYNGKSITSMGGPMVTSEPTLVGTNS